MKILMLRGLQASGKSTFAKELVKKDSSYVRVNKDDIRAMLGAEWSRESEKMVLRIRDDIIVDHLSKGKSVIVDDTNFNPKHENRLREISEAFKADFEIKDFDTPIWDCLERDAKREHPVGPKVIWQMYNKYVSDNKKYSEWKVEEGKKKCIIVDCDGTLSHFKNRTPYDYSKVKDDYCDVFVKDIVNRYHEYGHGSGYTVIIVSGREDSCKKDTEDWLRDNGVMYDYLYMRKTGDKRHDWEVKKEIYDNFIKPNYTVFFALDDRDQIVQLYRKMGIKTLQCGYGNF